MNPEFEQCLKRNKIREFPRGKALGKGKRLREDADYYDRWSEEGASFALKAAGDFLKKALELTKGKVG